MKKMLTFIFAMLAAGTGMNLYLPPFEPPETPKLQYTIMQGSLTKPLAASALQLSSLLLGDNSDNKYALQVGFYASMKDAAIGAKTLANEGLPSSKLPVIVKLKDPQKQWYILSLGPFSSEKESRDKKTELETMSISSQIILWPQEEKKKAEK